MSIDEFMSCYKNAWEQRDEHQLCALFSDNGVYRNTPFAEQKGHEAIAEYWQRVKLQEDIHLDYEILARTDSGGIANWRVSYQVASEKLFQIWAASTGTTLLARQADDPLPRLLLDGILLAEFNDDGLCTSTRLWWHSIIDG